MMRTLLLMLLAFPGAQDASKPYRLEAVDLKQRRIWGATAGNLSFGGQDQDAPDGRPHTRLRVGGAWEPIHEELREKNPLQTLHGRVRTLRKAVKDLRARLRHEYFEGRSGEGNESSRKTIVDELAAAAAELEAVTGDDYTVDQAKRASWRVRRASGLLDEIPVPVTAEAIRTMRRAQILLEVGAEALDSEPAARALDCGRKRREKGDAAQALVFDEKSGLYVLFGGDHLDYLTNDTWVFDPKARRWFQRHPEGAPPPRANHRMTAAGDGTVRLSGGYTYASNPDYLGGQYRDLADGRWVYDIAKDAWSGGPLVRPDARVYRTGAYHPDFYLDGPRPDRKTVAEKLSSLPVNEWVAMDPPYRPRLNRDWGTAQMDPKRDLLLRWSGGHSAHGGTDVPHYHFATNRWELPFAVEFPLGQLYSNTSYPDGFNFNLRPWITGHTYQNYAVDPPSGLMVKAGRPRHTYVYDPDVADWIGRSVKPKAMQYNSCFYTLTLVATPEGVICWDKNGRVHRYSHATGSWIEIELSGDRLAGAVVDYSTIAYDPNRKRVWMVATPGYSKAYDGRIWSLDPTTGLAKAFSPEGSEAASRFATVDRCVFDPENDLLVISTYLKEEGDHTATPAYDPKKNRWVKVPIAYRTEKRGDRVRRKFPTGRSAGVMYDPARKLIWGTDTNSQVYVLKLAPAR